MIDIRPVTPGDHLDISVLVTSAFRQPNEARLIEHLRDEAAVEIELLAEDEEGPVGHIAMARMRSPARWLSLGPVCVRPENERFGIGGALIIEALDRARRARFEAAVVVGDPAYYHRFGFVFDGQLWFKTPYPQQFTGFYWLGPGPITAGPSVTLAYPAAFATA